MKIGNIELANNVFLAPMAGVTDMVYRILCKEMGCGLVYSEMVSAKGIMYESKNTKKLLEIDQREKPVAVQLFGSDPKIMGDMAKKLDEYDIDILDINMGCPAPKIVKNGEGSALMKNPKLIGDIVYSVSNATNRPVTIKIRKGFDDENINAVEIAKIAEQNGAKAVTVHGRTREQYYSGKADWDIIKEVKNAVKTIPIIGNGDVVSPESAKELIEYTGCDAIMIGRAAQGNPWIFKRVLHYLNTGEILPPTSQLEKLELAHRHLDMLVDFKSEFIGVREMRKHLGWYIKGMPRCTEIKVIINKTETQEEMHKVLRELENIIV